MNGVKFLTKSKDDRLTTQNSGVTVPGVHDDVEDDYYGYLDEVVELSFVKGYNVILFKCTWFDTNRHRKHVTFEPNFISIDTSRKAYKEDPFVFANQARQVFYIDDPLKPNSQWKIIETASHRHLWDIPENINEPHLLEQVNLVREDGEEEIIEEVDIEHSTDVLDDFADDDIDGHDHNMEEISSESSEEDSYDDVF